ncbi:hypothetical protein ACFU7B_32780, partial [Streptomyces sp. NPDC057545]
HRPPHPPINPPPNNKTPGQNSPTTKDPKLRHNYDPDDKPNFKDGKPGGWHKADASIWNDLGAACTPHAAI